jgi:hypothetical protein
MKAGNWKNYQEFCSATDWMDPHCDNSLDRGELFEQWIEDWEFNNEATDIDENTEEVLNSFFDKIVYPDYFDGNSNCADWSLNEIKEELMNWYLENYEKLINQFGNLIRDVQRNNLINKSEETEVLKRSRGLYTTLSGSCI